MPVVFLTSSPDDADVFAAIVAGARGYVLKQTRSAELVRTLEAVGRGESLLDPRVTGMVLERIREIANGTDKDHANELTARELEILPLIAEGKTNKEIAAAVFPLGKDDQQRQLHPRGWPSTDEPRCPPSRARQEVSSARGEGDPGVPTATGGSSSRKRAEGPLGAVGVSGGRTS